MDLEELEKSHKPKPQTTIIGRYGCGATGSCRPTPSATTEGNGILGQMEEWEDYMQYGFAGLRPKGYEGL